MKIPSNLIEKNIFILFLLLILFSFTVSALDKQNLTLEEQASLCLEESKGSLNELINNNFSTLRVNDSLNQAKSMFNAQDILKKKNKYYDFSLVLTYCEEIKTIKEKAFEASDEFIALKKFYNELSVEGMNTTSIDEIIFEIEGEIKNERYEKVNPLINEAYGEIIKVRSDYTTLNIFYKTVTTNLKKFFYENWISFIVGLIILVILYFVYQNAIRQEIIKWKIDKLELRKRTLKDLIKTVQYEYFNRGKVSEGIYNIKTQKFAELIRDIDRQIPLLQEQLFKILKNKKNYKKNDG